MESQWPLVENKKEKKKKKEGILFGQYLKKEFQTKKNPPAFSDQSINDT